MRCVFRTTHCCLCTVCPLLSRITQDTIQPTDTASNRAAITPMPAMRVVELSALVKLLMQEVRVEFSACVELSSVNVDAAGVVTATVEL